jgi:hypothetical protein
MIIGQAVGVYIDDRFIKTGRSIPLPWGSLAASFFMGSTMTPLLMRAVAP